MLIEAARRAEAAAKETLTIVNEGSAPCAELRQMLEVSKAAMAIMSAAQVSAAADVAGRERHGDGGAEVLASSAGLSRREAHSQAKTGRTIAEMPKLRDAVESGRVSVANAKRLAEAVDKTAAADVDADGDLLAKAESMRPEQFTREARRWVADREDDGGESEHRRQRARRCVRVWDADDGMVHLHGQFDTLTGRRVGNRLRAEAAGMYDADKKNSKNSDERRSFPQCMADALDNLTANNNAGGSGKPIADICVVAHVDDATGKLIAEIPGGDRLPRSVLEELACNADITPAIYDRRGALLWQGHSKRTATAAQLKALKALHGGCFACGADFDMCQAHHVKPVSEGGPTNVDNMVPACWGCHNKVHYFRWQIHGPPRKRTLHPPDPMNYGPAHAPDHPPPLLNPDGLHAPDPPQENGSQPGEARPTQNGGQPKRPGPAAARAALRDAPAQSGSPPERPGPAAARAALRDAPAQSGSPPERPGPAAARAALRDAPAQSGSPPERPGPAAARAALRDAPAQSGSPPERPGPAAARAALQRGRAQRDGLDDPP